MSLLFQALRRLESERDVMASHPLSEADDFLPGARLNAALKSNSALTGPDDQAPQSRTESEHSPHTLEWPQPASNSSTADFSSPLTVSAEHFTAFAYTSVADSAASTLKLSHGIQGAVPAAMPVAEAILPVPDEGFSTNAPSKLTTPQVEASPTPSLQPALPADLVHMKSSLAELNTDYSELRNQIVAQESSFKRVRHHLEKVREAKDRNTHELREWIEELKGVGTKIRLVAMVAFALFGTSVIIDVMVYLHAF